MKSFPIDLYRASVRCRTRRRPRSSKHFAIEADGSFLLDTMLIEAVAG